MKKAIVFYTLIITITVVSICWSQTKTSGDWKIVEQVHKQDSGKLISRHFKWDYTTREAAYFSLTIYNPTKSKVDTSYRIIFYDSEGIPVDSYRNAFTREIHPKESSRFYGDCHISVMDLASDVKIEIENY